jgi:multiple sugar transport system permease protein
MQKMSPLKKRQALWAYAFLLVPMIFFIWIRIYPVFSSFHIALLEWDIFSKERPFVGLANFQRLLTDKTLHKALYNTFRYIIICVPIGLTLSLAIALMMNAIPKGAGFFRTLYFIPYITSTVAVAAVWKWMFMKSGGLINNILGVFGIPAQPFMNSTTQSLPVIAANIIWQGIGFQIIIFLAGLKQIPRTFYEAAAIDGASKWATFQHITIPLLNSTIVYLSVMAVIQTLQVFTQVFAISPGGSGGPLNSTLSMVLYIYQKAFKSFDMGYASAMTVLLFVIILIVSLLQMKLVTRKVEY